MISTCESKYVGTAQEKNWILFASGIIYSRCFLLPPNAAFSLFFSFYLSVSTYFYLLLSLYLSIYLFPPIFFSLSLFLSSYQSLQLSLSQFLCFSIFAMKTLLLEQIYSNNFLRILNLLLFSFHRWIRIIGF